MNKVCIVTSSLLKGGAEKQALYLTNVLAKKYEVILIILNSYEQHFNIEKLTNNSNIKIFTTKGKRLKKYLKVYKILKEESPAIIFSYLLQSNLLNGILGKWLKVPYRIGGIRSSYLTPLKFYFQRFIHNKLNTKTVFNNYKGMETLIRKGFDKDKAICIPNCIDIQPELKIREKNDIINILCVGRFHEAKDYKTSLDAIKFVQTKGYIFKCRIIGYGGLEKQIKDWINELNIGNVEIIVNPANIDDYYNKSDIFLQTSIYEGLSNTIMEAMSYSLPIVTTNVGDNDRLVEENKNGFLLEPGNAEGISNKLIVLIVSYEKRIEFGKRSYELVKANYPQEKFKNRYIDLIESLQ